MLKLDNIEIHWLGHSAFKIIAAGKKIYIDPFQIAVEAKDADIVLLSHPHFDHCSPEDLQKVVKDGTKMIMQADCQSKVVRIDSKVKMAVIEIGKKVKVDDILIEAVPAYNTNKEFHQKNQEWLGFVLEVAGKRIYHAGDTDVIPEMTKLKDIDVALLPVSGTYVMTADEAAEAAEKIKPGTAVPMHYGAAVGTDADADHFVKLCSQKGIKAEKLHRG